MPSGPKLRKCKRHSQPFRNHLMTPVNGKAAGMIDVFCDEAATGFGQDHHPERPARLINKQAYLLENPPDWVWMNPRLPSQEEVLQAHHPKHLERLRKPVDFDSDTPFYPE